MVTNVFQIKKIEHFGKEVQICLQNENGPCPLLAIANILLLKQKISIPPHEYIAAEDLITILSNYMLSRLSNISLTDEQKLNLEKNINDAINIFPQLLVGIDINIKFNDVNDFEFTNECLLFDLFGINLYHGWIPNPDDKIHSKLKKKSYNQIMDYVVNSKSENVDNKTKSLGKKFEEWLNDNASQITQYGIERLYQKIKEKEYAVFFRNNHFSTLLKYKDVLYLLVTDQGFCNSRITWEKLELVDGDNEFVDSNFKVVVQNENNEEDIPDIVRIMQEEEDKKIAIMLQKKEKNRAKKKKDDDCVIC